MANNLKHPFYPFYPDQEKENVDNSGERHRQSLREEQETTRLRRQREETEMLQTQIGQQKNPIPSDIYCTRSVPCAETEPGRVKLRATYVYFRVLARTNASTVAPGATLTETELGSWADALNAYVAKEFKKPLKEFLRRRMLNIMVERSKDGIPGIVSGESKVPPLNFDELKRYIKDDICNLNQEQKNNVTQRLFVAMFTDYRSYRNKWISDKCNQLLDEKGLRCKYCFMSSIVTWVLTTCLPIAP
jgi:hypothetical protein